MSTNNGQTKNVIWLDSMGRPRAPRQGIRIAGKTYAGGQMLPARYTRDTGGQGPAVDPAIGVAHAEPNFGRPIVPHVYTFSGILSSLAKTYRNPDEAIQHRRENARIMRNDPSIMECLEARQRGTALLNWHLEPENSNSLEQKDLCDHLTKILRHTPQFTEWRRNLMEAIWYGRHANEQVFGRRRIDGKMRYFAKAWIPHHGDKLAFRYDDGSGKFDSNQIGIRVGTTLKRDDIFAGRRVEEYTDFGLVYFLEKWERTRMCVHKHIIEDGEFEDIHGAGTIHGVGIRSRIYWAWFQKQETLAHLMELIERTGQGFTIYYYPIGNNEARSKVEEVASKQAHTNVILMPYDPANPEAYHIDRIEPNTAGIEAMRSMVKEFFGNMIKRYILGQILSTEPEATGLGSGVSDFQEKSLSDIVRYDAVKLEESITTEYLTPLKRFNFPGAEHQHIRFVIDTESPEAEKKMEGLQRLWDMGAKIKAADAYDVVGVSPPQEDEEVLQNPQFLEQDGGGFQPDPAMLGGDGASAFDDENADLEQIIGALYEKAPARYRATYEPYYGLRGKNKGKLVGSKSVETGKITYDGGKLAQAGGGESHDADGSDKPSGEAADQDQQARREEALQALAKEILKGKQKPKKEPKKPDDKTAGELAETIQEENPREFLAELGATERAQGGMKQRELEESVVDLYKTAARGDKESFGKRLREYVDQRFHQLGLARTGADFDGAIQAAETAAASGKALKAQPALTAVEKIAQTLRREKTLRDLPADKAVVDPESATMKFLEDRRKQDRAAMSDKDAIRLVDADLAVMRASEDGDKRGVQAALTRAVQERFRQAGLDASGEHSGAFADALNDAHRAARRKGAAAGLSAANAATERLYEEKRTRDALLREAAEARENGTVRDFLRKLAKAA